MAKVAARLGTTTHSLCAWIKRYDPQQLKTTESNDLSADPASSNEQILQEASFAKVS